MPWYKLTKKAIIPKVMSTQKYFLCAWIFFSWPALGLDQRLSLGLIGGITANGASGESVDILYDSKGQKVAGALSNTLIGGELGMLMQYQLREYFFGVQTELMFLFNRGLTYHDVVNADFKARMYGHQAALNFLLQGIITTNDMISFVVFAGPSFTFPMTDFQQSIAYKKTAVTDRMTFTPLGVSYGIVAGLGLHIELGPGFFLIDGRFAMDFTDFASERNISLNTPLAVQVGYSFYLLGGKR